MKLKVVSAISPKKTRDHVFAQRNCKEACHRRHPNKMKKRINSLSRKEVVLDTIMEFVKVGDRGKFHSAIYHKLLHSFGMEDPLCDSKTKLAMLREHCRGILTKEIDDGHSHDGKPNEVNSIILEWVASIESEISLVASSH